MAINKKLIHFNEKSEFEKRLANNEILDTSIVFIKDSKEIWTHGNYYAGVDPEDFEKLQEDVDNKADKTELVAADFLNNNNEPGGMINMPFGCRDLKLQEFIYDGVSNETDAGYIDNYYYGNLVVSYVNSDGCYKSLYVKISEIKGEDNKINIQRTPLYVYVNDENHLIISGLYAKGVFYFSAFSNYNKLPLSFTTPYIVGNDTQEHLDELKRLCSDSASKIVPMMILLTKHYTYLLANVTLGGPPNFWGFVGLDTNGNNVAIQFPSKDISALEVGQCVEDIGATVTATPLSSTPDWNANAGAAGYIENRTHYSDRVRQDLPSNVENYEMTFGNVGGRDANLNFHFRGNFVTEVIKVDDTNEHIISKSGVTIKIKRKVVGSLYFYVTTNNTFFDGDYIESIYVVKQLPDYYIPNTIARTDDLIDPMISVTYSELKTLRDNSQLIPGQQYRITDYITTTTQENTRSAGHQFDIIVTADDENTLNEVARACRSEFDIEKFKDAYSNSWQEHMLYVGIQEYEGEEYHLYESDSQDLQMLVSFDNTDVGYYPEQDYSYDFLPAYTRYKEETSFGEWLNGKDEGESIAFKHNPTIATYFKDSNLNSWQIWYSLDNDAERFAWADAENGKGIIYRMIDEWNNDCPYDFKNIQFNRGVYDGGGIAPDGDEDMHFNLFTFSFRTENNEIIDTSIFGNNGRLLNDEGQISGVYGNVIGQYMNYDNSIENPTKTTQRLNDIVFYSHYDYEGNTYYGCFSNSFGDNCYSNSFGNNCYANSFADNCIENSFSDHCYNNSFGDDCFSNSFGNSCGSNSFSDSCHDNSFSDNCYNNSFGNDCHYNSFGEYCSSNSFGNYCEFNSFDNNCHYNSFGNYCRSNSFGNYCNNNSFGNSCDSNSFGNEFYDNSFGNNCYYNGFGNYCEYNSLGNGCSSNSFGNSCQSNSFDNDCDYNSFGNLCDYNSFGNSCGDNSFEGACYSNSFGNDCRNNSFGAGCSSNIFGNDCEFNSFDINCSRNSFGNDCDSNSLGMCYCFNSFGNDCCHNSFRSSASKTASLKNYCYYNHFDDGCFYNVIWNSDTTSTSNKLRNINVNRGVSGTNTNYNFININTINSEQEINVNQVDGIVSIGEVLSIKYESLKALRDNSQLIPGRQYRIIDYNTTTSQANTTSAGHQFDIIVTAINEYTLSEEAQAIQNYDDGYFDESNLSAWKIWYCLDNDTERFEWAGDERIENEEVEVTTYDSSECTIKSELIDGNTFITPFNFESCVWVDANGDGETYVDEINHDAAELVYEWGYFTDEDDNTHLCLYKSDAGLYEEEGQPDYGDKYLYRGVIDVDGTDYDYWQKWDENGDGLDVQGSGDYVFATTPRIVSNPEAYSYEATTETIETVIPLEPKGVIYRMIDEFGNECPYDFKNIMFKTELSDTYGFASNDSNSFSKYLYTFSYFREDGFTRDASIDGNDGWILDNGDAHRGVFNNVMKACYFADQGISPKQILNKNIYLWPQQQNGEFDGCYGNIFEYDCSENKMHLDSQNNCFKQACCKNELSGDKNYLGPHCSKNKIYGDSNRLECNCSNNKFAGNRNIFTYNCNSNVLGKNSSNNYFEHGCSYNVISFDEDRNSIRGWFSNNYLSRNCSYNIIWNEKNDSTWQNAYEIQNLRLKPGVRGNYKLYNTMHIESVNNDYEITIAKNSSGDIKIYCEADLIA